MRSDLKAAVEDKVVAHSTAGQKLFLVCLTVLILCAFANSFPVAFIGDDLDIVAHNPLVLNFDLGRILTTDYWGELANSGLYRPLAIVSFALGHLFWGASANMVHAVNLGLHLLVSLLLVVVLQGYGLERKLAWLAGTLFALHPIHTEVINEAVGRAELLAALGALLALWGWQHLEQARGWLLLILGYGAGLLAKENAIVLLSLLPLLVFFSGQYREQGWRPLIKPYLLLVGITAAWLAWRTWGVVRLVPPDGHDRIYTPLAYLPPLERFLTALKFQWLYLRKLLFPFDLQGIYSGSNFFKPVPGVWSFEGAFLLLATGLLFAGVLVLYRKRKPLGLGFMVYFVAVTPVANLFFVTGATFAERLVYLPSVGLCLALAAFLKQICSRGGTRLLLVAVVLVAGCYFSLTILRNPDFRSSQALWQKDVQRDPENILAWLFLAQAEATAGQVGPAQDAFDQLQKRAPHFSEGARLYAQFLFEEGRYSAAIQTALPVANNPEATYPEIYLLLGRAYEALGEHGTALQWLKQVPAAYRMYGVYWENRGRALEGLGDIVGAIASYQRMGTYSKESEIPERLGHLLLQTGRVDAARISFLAAVRLNPASASSWNSLGVTQAMGGAVEAAHNSFLQAVRLAPDNNRYRENLERAVVPK